ncbi:MAG: zf-HC2 domain-containing protein [Clostridia bacterium]|nr:zf-HC2 domain-containing protein [Clostridia bacterium]
MKNCDITRDLLPLYIDSSCSEDSREFVDTHMAGCDACRAVHAAASKTVRTVLADKKVKKSFTRFRRKTRIKKTLLILLCIVLCLTALGFALWPPVWDYLTRPHLCRTEPVETKVCRLSDGSIYISLRYTEEDVYICYAGSWNDSKQEGTLTLSMQHEKLLDLTRPGLNEDRSFPFVIITDESAELYNLKESRELWKTSMPYTEPPYSKVVLIGSDGERVIWQEDDDIPDADEYTERYLQQCIDEGRLILNDAAQ